MTPSTVSSDANLLPPPLQASPTSWSDFAALLALPAGKEPVASDATLLLIYNSPLKLELYQGGILQIAINGRSLLHWEHSKYVSAVGKEKNADGEEEKDRHQGKNVVDYGEDGGKRKLLPYYSIAIHWLL
jgi:hypothetical protein